MSEKESTAKIAKRVQQKLRQPIPHEKNKYPLLEKSTVQHTPEDNVCVHGVVAKGKRELQLKPS